MKNGHYYEVRYKNEIEIVTISHPLCQASVSRQGAQVLSFASATGEVLWCSKQASYQRGKAIRGGIPICFPYFGAHKMLPDAPSHGFARVLDFTLVNVLESTTGVTLLWELSTADVTAFRSLFAYAFTLQVEQHFSESLRVSLHLKNESSEPFSFGEALHTYLATDALEMLNLDDLNAYPFLDQLSNMRATQNGVRINQEIDRIYDVPDPFTLNTPLQTRKSLELKQSGAKQMVVWNPYIEKSKRLADMADEEYRNMICLESANTEEVVLKPGEQHTLQLHISLLQEEA